MEEVFLRIGDLTSEKDSQDTASIKNGSFHGNDGQENKVFGLSYTKATGFGLFLRHFRAMVTKRVINSYRSPIVSLVQLMIPVAFTLIGIYAGNASTSKLDDGRALTLTVNEFRSPVVLVGLVNPTAQYMDSLQVYLKQVIGATSAKYDLVDGNSNITNAVLSIGHTSLTQYSQYQVVGVQLTGGYNDSELALKNAMFDNDVYFISSPVLVTGFFNGQPYHTAPMALNIIGNLLARFFTASSDKWIEVTNHPLPRLIRQAADKSYNQQVDNAFQMSTIMMFGMSVLMGTFVIFLIKERSCKSKHIQMVSGVQITSFWLATFTWDFINFMIPTILIILVFVGQSVHAYIDGDNWGYILLLFILCAFSVLPLLYLISFLFDVPATGVSLTTLICVVLGQWLQLAVYVLTLLNYKNTAKIMRWTFYVFIPNYCFADALNLLNLKYQAKQLCVDMTKTLAKEQNLTLDSYCTNTKKENKTFACCTDNCGSSCLGWTGSYISMDPSTNGIGPALLFMGFHFFLYFGILLVIESGRFKTVWESFTQGLTRSVKNVQPADEDSDVAIERNFIMKESVANLIAQNAVVVKGLCKQYGSFLAVDSLSFFIKDSECFGLLGVNGAGKTTTFKMLTGDHTVSAGDAYLRGYSVRKDIAKVRNVVGYCPQFDALIDIMTVNETLAMYARLRGIEEGKVQQVVDNIMANLLVSQYKNIRCGNLSGGNKRKVSTGIALIGDPFIIFLDEPTTGMDPVARRLLWNTLTQIRNSGRTLVLTSHSMEECEALCTKIAIMVNGQFKCLGTSQHLKSKFGEGYALTAKIAPVHDNPQETTVRTDNFIKFIMNTYAGAGVKDYHLGYVTMFIKTPGLKWADIFELVEHNKEIFYLDDYSVSQTTLEQVFLTLARAQRMIANKEGHTCTEQLGFCCKFCFGCHCCKLCFTPNHVERNDG